MDEYVDVVDDNDKVIGKATRKECHATGKIHRGVHIFILNSKGELLLGKRSMNKDLYPSYLGDVGGHIDTGESYEHAAKRELMEEAGIACDLKKLFSLKKRYLKDNENVAVFTCKYDCPITLNHEEFDSSEFYNIDTLKKKLDKNEISISPGTVLAFKEFYRLKLRSKNE